MPLKYHEIFFSSFFQERKGWDYFFPFLAEMLSSDSLLSSGNHAVSKSLCKTEIPIKQSLFFQWILATHIESNSKNNSSEARVPWNWNHMTHTLKSLRLLFYLCPVEAWPLDLLETLCFTGWICKSKSVTVTCILIG